MALWKPDPTFCPSPRDAASAPPASLAYVAAFDRAAEKPDAIAVLDVDPHSISYGSVVGCDRTLYGSWDDQFYPDGVGAWMAKVDSGRSFTFDERFFPSGDDFRGFHPHQTRLQGGDASSDSYCYP